MRSLLRLAGVVAAVCAVTAVGADAPARDPLDRPALAAPLAAESLLLDVVVLPTGNVVCVGERGHVLLSRDQGRHFEQRIAPTRSTLTRVYFLDAERGWAVGHDEVILRTTDGGATWTRVHYAPEHRQPLFDVWVGADGVGYAVGAYSAFLRTADYGATWEAVPFAPAALAAPKKDADGDADLGVSQPHLYGLRSAGPGRLYLAAEAGHLYRSDDTGRTWREIPSPYAGSLFGVLPLDGDALLAYGLRGHLFRSDDAGAHWRPLAGGTDLLSAATRLPGGGVAVVGLSGVVLLAPDGVNFSMSRQEDRLGYSGVAVAADGLVLVGEGGIHHLALGAAQKGAS